MDNKEFILQNILSSKYPYKWFANDKEELLHKELPIIPYPNKKYGEINKELELYNLEKQLFYGCYFILGKANNPIAKDNRICAPLFLFPAELEINEGLSFLRIDRSNYEINRYALQLLELQDDEVDKGDFLKELTRRLEAGNLIGIKSFLDRSTLNLDTEDLLLFPTVWNAAKIRKYLSKENFNDNIYKIVPAAGTALVEKSEASLRILNDLEKMAKHERFSENLEKLLNDKRDLLGSYQSIYKNRLNSEQYVALKNANKFSNSVIIGPPGTGKSYTINSIVVDALMNNNSVLVVSKTKQAVEVIREMLEDDFKLKDYLIHTSGFNYKVSLKSKIRKYLSGVSGRKRGVNLEKFDYLIRQLERLESEFEELIEQELRLSNLSFNDDLNLWQKWEKFYLSKISYKGEKLLPTFDKMNTVFNDLEKEISVFSRHKIASNITKSSIHYRKDISKFYDALDSSSFSVYKRILEDIDQSSVLKVFPVWLANLSDLNSILPLEENLFDLVLIDEATQCDIASALPAIFRAKRAVIIGDPNQLRHYSFVSRAQQIELQQQYNLPEDASLDYRNRSILDLYLSKIQDQHQITFLREHFRSTPSLVEFSNQKFYNGQLEVLKSTPDHINENQLDYFEVDGTRNERGVNTREAEFIIERLKAIVTKYKGSDKKPSLGIISPFNSQVIYIKNLIRDTFDINEIKKYKLFCDTPYNFQGSEREIIFLSFCVCNESHHSAFIHLNKPEVFNVAITRARSYQAIVTSVELSKLNQNSLLFEYLNFIKNFDHESSRIEEHDSFQREVVSFLEKKDFKKIECGYPVAGCILDILITNGSKNYFIDLIGYPGSFEKAFSLERYKTLARIGIRCFPLHYSFWKRKPHIAQRSLLSFVKN
ncbi:Superfamily I DNA and/or RNA helicase [Zunongwangia mangrovi]|uniref:Superfamily I DNA and/or RNA helicase n=1 Tax=Zunongwangia mangrovi TaxID=1334022 RepID=A0A1I1EEA4_9FLAO|nr:Superfamily I DNA and/or RNA helicase [Zunongwangia mangrovi]